MGRLSVGNALMRFEDAMAEAAPSCACLCPLASATPGPAWIFPTWMAGLPEGGTSSQADKPGHLCVTDVPLGAGGPQTPAAGRALCQAPGLGQAWTLVVTPSPLQCDSGYFTCFLWDLEGSQAGKWLWLMAPLPIRRENGHSRAGVHA